MQLALSGGHVLMGTDAPESMGFKCQAGNNVYINLEPDARAEADRLFDARSAGGKVDGRLGPAAVALQGLGHGFGAIAKDPEALYVATRGKPGGDEIWRLSLY